MITELISSESATSFGALYRTLYYLCCGGITLALLLVFRNRMPCDQGRAYAVNGELSRGKIRGVGIHFVLGYAIATLLFVPLSWELSVLLLLMIASMVTGFLDDAGSVPWSGLKKGLLDLAISLGAGFAAWQFYGNTIRIARLAGFSDAGSDPITITVPWPIFVLLAAALVWGSINVVNCTDGVDGLCATLSITALTAFALLAIARGTADTILTQRPICVGMIACLIPYLWFNASPSSMLMGDAGSRALGLLFAMLALRSTYVLFYFAFCIIFMLDGGLGLLKLALLRSVKIHILKNTRTPLHDHARKNLQWSDTQTVLRFALLQAFIIIAVLAATGCFGSVSWFINT